MAVVLLYSILIFVELSSANSSVLFGDDQVCGNLQYRIEEGYVRVDSDEQTMRIFARKWCDEIYPKWQNADPIIRCIHQSIIDSAGCVMYFDIRQKGNKDALIRTIRRFPDYTIKYSWKNEFIERFGRKPYYP